MTTPATPPDAEYRARELRMHYIGACCLLGRLSRHVRHDSDRDLIETALADCARLTGTMRVVRCADGSFTLEPT